MQNSLISTTDLTTLLQSNHLVCSASVTFTLKDSTQYTITADNIIKYDIQTDLMESNKISLGSCVPSVGDIEVISSAITFNTKKVAYYTIYYSILMPNNVTQAVPLGTFYPDNISANGLTTVFKGYDILKKFDKVFKESQVNRATVTSLYTRFTQACTICGISSPTITVDDNPDGDASYIFNTLTGYCMPQQDFDTYRSYVGCIAAACGCSVAAGREPNTLRLVSIFRQSDSNVDYTFSDNFVSISERWARSVLFTEIRFRNYSKLATGTRIDDYDIESLVADDSIEKMYKYGKNPFIEPQAMWDELDGRRCYIRARNRIRSQFGNSYEFFNLEIAPIPAFDTGDTLKILGADGSWHWIYISGWTFDGLTLTLNFGDPGSGASATSTGGAGLGYATAGGQTSQALNTLENEDFDTTKVVKEKTRKLDNGTYRKFNYEYDVIFNKKAENFLDSERIDVLSSRWLHAEKRLDVSPYETTGCKYNIEFPAVIYTTARHQNSKYMVEMRASATGVIPCTVSGTLNTEARIVGYIDSCTQYACLDTSWDYGASRWYRNENHIHAVQKMAKFKMLDANGNVYGINSLENLKIKFDNNSKFKSGGWGGTNNALLKAVKIFSASFDETATNNAVDDIGEYLQKASIYTDIPEECITKASSATVESNPGAIVAFDRHLNEDRPEYLSLCDSTLAHVGNYSLSGTAEDVLAIVNNDGYWEIPANHFEYFYFRAVTHQVPDTEPGVYYLTDVNIYLHIVQPEVYIDIGKTLNDIKNKIYIDFGYIDKDDGWYSRNSSQAQPYWYNFTPKWSIAPYANGHEDTWNSSHEGNMENDAVRGEYLSAIRKFRNPKGGYYPIYLAQTSGGDFKLYGNDTRYQTEYDDAVAMMEGDVTVYTNLFDDTEESFISGKWNSSENIADGSNSIIGSYNHIDGQNNNVDSGYTVIGSLNNIAGFAEHEKGEPDCNILIGSNNTLKDFKGLAFLNANYGFIVDSLNDDIWVYFGRTEKYSMRLIFKKFLNVITTITRNGTALPINDGVVDIPVPEALSELTDDETHRLVTDTEKATWNGKQDALTWDSVPTENSLHPVTSGGIKTALDTKQDTLIFDTTPTANSTKPVTSGGVYDAITCIPNLESRMTTAEGEIDTLQTDLGALTTRVGTAEGEIDTLQSDMSGLGTRMTTAEGEIDTLQSDTSNLGTRMTTAEGEIDTLQTDLGALTTRVGTAEGDIDSLESSVSGLSTRMTTAEGDIDTLEGNVSSLSTRMTSAEGDIDTLESSVSGLSTRMTTAEGDIDTLESGLSGLTTRVTTAEGEIDTLQSDLTNLTTRVGTAEGDIDTLESDKMDKTNPTGTGALSLNRLADSTVGTNSVALGTDATASGTNSLAGGRQAVASGTNSLAYGNNATASAGGAIALGNSANASSVNAVALGFRATASGKHSVALSGGTTSGDYTLAMGRDTEAHYDYSIALGRGVTTSKANQVVVGEFNATNANASFIVGGGENSDGLWNIMWIEGNDMYIQGTNSRSRLSVVNVGYLQDNYRIADVSTLEAELVEIYNSIAAYTNAAD